jgi:hypothetical protein
MRWEIGSSWTPSPALFELHYSTYDSRNFTEFLLQYNYIGPLFPLDDGDDFDKIGIDKGGAQYR